MEGPPRQPDHRRPAGWNTTVFDDSGVGQRLHESGCTGSHPGTRTSPNRRARPPSGWRAATNFAVGDQISIDTGANQETRTVASASGTGANAIADRRLEPFTIVHSPGDAVLDLTRPGTGITFTPALAQAHDVLATRRLARQRHHLHLALVHSHAAGTAIRGAGSGITFTPALGGEPRHRHDRRQRRHRDHLQPGAHERSRGRRRRRPASEPTSTTTASQINFTVNSAQTYTGGLRGGFRFEAIELRTAGTVTLSGAGLNFRAYRAGPDKYEGWFISSDDQLNRMWYAGAYTAQMDMVPGRRRLLLHPARHLRRRQARPGDLVRRPDDQRPGGAALASARTPRRTSQGSIDAFMNLQAGQRAPAPAPSASAAAARSTTRSRTRTTAAMIAVQYYRYTGDTAYITKLLPKLEAATAYAASRLDANGLIVTNDNDYWQTRQNGEVTEYNLAYYELLQDMIWLESHVGTPEKVDRVHGQGGGAQGRDQLAPVQPRRRPVPAHGQPARRVPARREHERRRLGVVPADKVQHILDYFKDGVGGARQPDHPAGAEHDRPLRPHHRAAEQHLGDDRSSPEQRRGGRARADASAVGPPGRPDHAVLSPARSGSS